jgi:hypothetical protein
MEAALCMPDRLLLLTLLRVRTELTPLCSCSLPARDWLSDWFRSNPVPPLCELRNPLLLVPARERGFRAAASCRLTPAVNDALFAVLAPTEPKPASAGSLPRAAAEVEDNTSGRNSLLFFLL